MTVVLKLLYLLRVGDFNVCGPIAFSLLTHATRLAHIYQEAHTITPTFSLQCQALLLNSQPSNAATMPSEEPNYPMAPTTNQDEDWLNANKDDSLMLATGSGEFESSEKERVMRRRRFIIVLLLALLLTLVVMLASVLAIKDQSQANDGSSAEFLWGQAGECDEPTIYNQAVESFTACLGPSDCTEAGECCVAIYCFCMAPNFEISEMCVPDS
jgi:hypothetical protein